MKQIYFTFLSAIFVLFICSTTVFAQNEESYALKVYKKHIAHLLQEGGKWKAKNKDYNPAGEWSVSYFGYEFKKGINDNTVLLKITGYFPKKSQWIVFWDGFYTWDYKKQKAVYQSVNTEGAFAMGESESVAENEMVLVFNITSSEGKIEKHKDIEKLENDTIQSNSFKFKANKWEPNNQLTWSRLEKPVGTISYLSTQDGNYEVYSMNAEGNEVKNLSKNTALDYWSSWSPDGKYILFYSDRGGNKDIYRMDADGKNQVKISRDTGQHYLPEWSPDGKKIVYVAERDGKSRCVFIMNADGLEVTRLTDNDLYEESPSFSPDGKQIIFTRQIREEGDTSHASNGEIFIMDVNGKNVKRLTNKKGFDSGAKFSPDGEKIAFYGTDENDNYELFIMNADGSNIFNLTEDPLEDYSPNWSPDGKWIAYSKGDSSNYDVWIIHVETKIKTRLTTQPKRDQNPVWKPVYN